jgi:hypothetical protein
MSVWTIRGQHCADCQRPICQSDIEGDHGLLAIEYANRGIRVNVVSLGMTKSPMMRRFR